MNRDARIAFGHLFIVGWKKEGTNMQKKMLRSNQVEDSLRELIEFEAQARASGGGAALLLLLPHARSEPILMVDGGVIIPEEEISDPGDDITSSLDAWFANFRKCSEVQPRRGSAGYWASHPLIDRGLMRLCDSMATVYEHDGSNIVTVRIEVSDSVRGLFVAVGGKPMKDLHTCTPADMIRAIGYYVEQARRFRGLTPDLYDLST